jgi:hypothetical protein
MKEVIGGAMSAIGGIFLSKKWKRAASKRPLPSGRGF